MDESRRLEMRRAHTKHKIYCTCGKIVCGNGGKANHRAMHERRSDGHHGLVRDAWLKMFPPLCDRCSGKTEHTLSCPKKREAST